MLCLLNLISIIYNVLMEKEKFEETDQLFQNIRFFALSYQTNVIHIQTNVQNTLTGVCVCACTNLCVIHINL